MGIGSALFLSIKLGWVYLSELIGLFPAYLSYALLHILLFFIGWIYHTSVTFGVEGDVGIFRRYLYVNAIFKLIDYLVFVLLTYAAGSYPVFSVLISSAFVFLLRYFSYSRLVFSRV